jgi:predicted enzyme related to lactoylglutathione lyase
MTTPATFPGAPCWADLFTTDPARARDFYADVFGWTAEDAGPEYGGYFNFSKDGARVAGGMRNDGEAGTPDAWSTYLRVTDAHATVDRATAAGADVIVPAMQVMDLGTMAVLADPGHAAIGMWQPGEHQGFAVVDEPGTPSWFELHTRDYDASVAFYRDVFGLDAQNASEEVPEFRYTTLGQGDARLAGIMDASGFLPEGVPARWSVYFRVDDVDSTLSLVTKLGGEVVSGPDDSPFGRLAEAADPTGALFKLVAGS